MNGIKVFIQRLWSLDWRTAWSEFTILTVAAGIAYHAFATKHYMDALAALEDPNIAAALGALALFVRLAISSNAKAIANPALPDIIGPLKPLDLATPRIEGQVLNVRPISTEGAN